MRRLALLLPAGLLALAAYRLVRMSALQYFLPGQLAQALPRLLPDAGTTVTALVAALAPLPLACAFCVWRQRRRLDFDTADRLTAAAVVFLLVHGALFATLLATGTLNRLAFAAGAVVVAAAGLAILVRQLRRAGPLPWRDTLGKPLLSAAAALVVLAGGGLLSLYLGQDYNIDLRYYHYFNAHAWLHGRTDLRRGVADVMTYFNPLIDVPFYLLARELPPVWVGLLVGAAQSLPAVFAFALAYKVFKALGLFGPRPLAAALLCAVAGLFEPVCVTELGTTFVDSALTALVLASLTAAVVALSECGENEARRRFAWLAAAGALAGLAAGLKLTLATFCVAGAAAVVLITPGWRRRLTSAAGFCGAALAAFLAAHGFWMLRLASELGNPTFPYFNTVFRSPYYPPVEQEISYTGGEWPGRLLLPFTFWRYERHGATEVPFADLRLMLLLALAAAVGGVIVWRAWRQRGWQISRVAAFLAAYTVVAYLVWDAKFHVLRYFCPVLVMAPLLIVLLLRTLTPGPRTCLAAAVAVCCLIVGGMKVSSYGRVPWTDDFLQLQACELDVKPRALVLMTWDDPPGRLTPNNQLLTLFPPDALFVNLDSSVVRCARGRQEAEALVAAHAGPIYLLAHPEAGDRAEEKLRAFHVRREGDPVGRLEAPLVSLRLWEVRRDSPAGPTTDEDSLPSSR